MIFRRVALAPISALALILVFISLLQSPSLASKANSATSKLVAADGQSVAPTDREAILGHGWNRSNDRAWTTSSDAAGFHILVADKKSGYTWRTAATLSEPGFDTDMWIGNACVTGSGRRAVVAYSPRTFTNKPDLMARGAFTAVVDLTTGAVTKLNRQATLAYFSPGCGTGETAVFTQAGGETKNATRLIKVDATTGRMGSPIEVKGEVTSAIPVGQTIVAADAARLVKIDTAGHRTALAGTGQVPFMLRADADGGVVFMDRPATGSKSSPAQGQVKRITAQDIAGGDVKKTKPVDLATGPLTRMDLTASADGKVFITGDTKTSGRLPDVIKQRADVAAGAAASTRGAALVISTTWADGKDPRAAAAQAGTARPAAISIKNLATGKEATFQVVPGQASVGKTVHGAERSPALPPLAPRKHPKKASSGSTGTTKSPQLSADSTVDDSRTCSIPRNDPAQQVMQPKPRQVEWAVDQAITGNLNSLISRPANWKNDGMAAYQPQTLFPPHQLSGGGRIPAQVMLGVTAQESNMWQASSHVVPGETGNPLIANYYGTPYTPSGQQQDPWAINWDDADCGYGVTQVTDGMRLPGKSKPGETPLSTLQQQAVAMDYTANIAAGVNILADKWNQTKHDGLIIDNGLPQYPENWFFALWAYNSGYHTQADAANNGGQWGVGWTNNPADPLWKANRLPFLEKADGTDDYTDAAHPQDWPYEEKVLGWAARPLQALESPGTMVVGYRAAWWTTTANRTSVKPPIGLFCTTANECDPSKISTSATNDPGLGPCTRTDLKCWWTQPASWKSCANGQCGNEILRFDSTYAEQADGTAYPPNCSTTGLPSNALIVDDVPDSTPIHRPNCSVPKASSGSFSLTFGSDSARIDLHQLGAGYDGHFWFVHARDGDTTGQRMATTGTWQLDNPINGEAQVWAHIPDHGAQALVTYQIDTGYATLGSSMVQSGATNRWVNLGVYQFKSGSTPQVHLSNIVNGENGTQDVAFDAMAFVPGNFSHMPDITLPADDPTAPDPEYSEGFRKLTMPSEGLPAATTTTGSGNIAPDLKAAKKLAESNCRISNAAKDQKVCSALIPNNAGRPKPNASTGASSCDGRAFSRDRACTDYTFLLIWMQGSTVIGTGTFDYSEQITLDRSATVWSESVTLTPIALDPALTDVTVNVEFDCIGPCNSPTQAPNWGSTPPTWNPVLGYTHTATAYVTNGWVQGTSWSNMNLHWKVWGVFGSGLSNTEAWDEPALQIRCDNLGSGNRLPGCVFPNFTPTFQLNTKKYPAAAAMYWLMQEKLSTHPGSFTYNQPLHRLQDQDAQNNNRGKMCKLAVAEWDPNPDTPDASCDEYPFAASEESGGQALYSGKLCVQLYAINPSGDPSGPWKVRLDPRYPLPDWGELCGRGSIPARQNSDAGSPMSGFFSSARVLDGEAFYVGEAGFENCDPNLACVVSP